MDSVERYLEVFEGLRRRKRWSTGIEILRFAALTLAATDLAEPGSELEETAKVLSKEAGGFSPLSSAVRHAVAAILIRRGLDPVITVHRTKETLAAFKEFKLTRSGAHPLLAALVLVLDAGGGAPSRDTIARMKAIIDRWDEDHWFLTGVDDYPMAAMHATRDVSIEQLGMDVEQISPARVPFADVFGSRSTRGCAAFRSHREGAQKGEAACVAESLRRGGAARAQRRSRRRGGADGDRVP
jgi:hypothetical protein